MMRTRRIFGSLACGAILLSSVAACSDKPDTSPAAAPSPSTDASSVSDPAALVNLGIQQGQGGQVDDAKATFEKAVSLDDNNKYAWFNLGYIAQTRNQADEAIKNYDHALQADRAYKPALYNKAIVLEGKDPQAAINLYRTILSIDGKAGTADLRMGLVLAAQGDDAGAVRAFKAAVKVDAGLARSVPAKYRSDVTGSDR